MIEAKNILKNHKPLTRLLKLQATDSERFKALVGDLRKHYQDECEGEGLATGKRLPYQFAANNYFLFTPEGKVLTLVKPLEGRGQSEFAGWYKDEEGRELLVKRDANTTCAQEATMSDQFLPAAMRRSINIATLGFEKRGGKVEYITIQPKVGNEQPSLRSTFEASDRSSSLSHDRETELESPQSVTTIASRDTVDLTEKVDERSSNDEVSSLDPKSLHSADRAPEPSTIIPLPEAIWQSLPEDNKPTTKKRKAKTSVSYEKTNQSKIIEIFSALDMQPRMELASALFASQAMGDESVHIGQYMTEVQNGKIEHITRIDFGARGRFAKKREETDDHQPDETSYEYENSGGFSGIAGIGAIRQDGKNYLTLMLEEPKLHYVYNLIWIEASATSIVSGEQSKIDEALTSLPEDEKEQFLVNLLDDFNRRADKRILIPRRDPQGRKLTTDERVKMVKYELAKLTMTRALRMKHLARDKLQDLQNNVEPNDRAELVSAVHERGFAQTYSLLTARQEDDLLAVLTAERLDLTWHYKAANLLEHVNNQLENPELSSEKREEAQALKTLLEGERKLAKIALSSDIASLIKLHEGSSPDKKKLYENLHKLASFENINKDEKAALVAETIGLINQEIVGEDNDILNSLISKITQYDAHKQNSSSYSRLLTTPGLEPDEKGEESSLKEEKGLCGSVRASDASLEGVEEIQEEVNNKVERDSPTSVAEDLDPEAQGSFKSR